MWRRNGTLPAAGGWLDQPLTLLVQMQALETVYQTWTAKNQKQFDWGKFSATQRDIIRHLDGE